VASPQASIHSPGRPHQTLALTAREREVLALIGSGTTSKEIARGLFVSEGTVKTHVNHVFAKLGLRDRAAAVIFALDHNLTGRAG
jgi:DNA-binding NarL/FixJ family response regulator